MLKPVLKHLHSCNEYNINLFETKQEESHKNINELFKYEYLKRMRVKTNSNTNINRFALESICEARLKQWKLDGSSSKKVLRVPGSSKPGKSDIRTVCSAKYCLAGVILELNKKTIDIPNKNVIYSTNLLASLTIIKTNNCHVFNGRKFNITTAYIKLIIWPKPVECDASSGTCQFRYSQFWDCQWPCQRSS